MHTISSFREVHFVVVSVASGFIAEVILNYRRPQGATLLIGSYLPRPSRKTDGVKLGHLSLAESLKSNHH